MTSNGSTNVQKRVANHGLLKIGPRSFKSRRCLAINSQLTATYNETRFRTSPRQKVIKAPRNSAFRPTTDNEQRTERSEHSSAQVRLNLSADHFHNSLCDRLLRFSCPKKTQNLSAQADRFTRLTTHQPLPTAYFPNLHTITSPAFSSIPPAPTWAGVSLTV
jgi:hypothetical protein